MCNVQDIDMFGAYFHECFIFAGHLHLHQKDCLVLDTCGSEIKFSSIAPKMFVLFFVYNYNKKIILHDPQEAYRIQCCIYPLGLSRGGGGEIPPE